MSDYGGDDLLAMNASIAMRVQSGFVESVDVAFYEDYEPSEVWIPSPKLDSVFYLTSNVAIED